MLDGLADGLNEAVATAVKEAVRAVLTEVLTNPELLARLAAAQGVPTIESRPKSELLARTGERVCGALGTVGRQMMMCRVLIGRICDASWKRTFEASRWAKAKASRMLIAGACLLLRARHFVGPVLAAVAVGGMTGLAGECLGPWFAAGVSAAGGLGIALGPPTSPEWFARIWPGDMPAPSVGSSRRRSNGRRRRLNLGTRARTRWRRPARG